MLGDDYEEQKEEKRKYSKISVCVGIILEGRTEQKLTSVRVKEDINKITTNNQDNIDQPIIQAFT